MNRAHHHAGARGLLGLSLAALLAFQPVAAATEEPPPLQEKVVWGVLGKTVLSSVFSIFSRWLNNRLTGGTPETRPECPTPVSGQALTDSGSDSRKEENRLPTTTQELKMEIRREVRGAVVIELAKIVFGAKSPDPASFSHKDTSTVVGTPAAPFRSIDGRPNYQGIHIAIVAVDKDGKPLGFHSVNQGFQTGQRFRLRVVSTFDGLLAIDNINPAGVQRRVYPAKSSQVVSIQAGEEVLLPLDARQAFQFAGTKGREQLLIAMRHPQAFGDGASRNPVYRKDEQYGSNLVQEVATNTYPAIFQSIELRHD
jgi:hypothetical protein